MTRLFQTALLIATLIALMSLFSGCGYALKGKVVRGETSSIEMVHQIDPRLKEQGVLGAETMVRRDPKSPNPQLVGRDRSSDYGMFTMHINEFGAGWMDEKWLIQTRLTGFQNAQALMKLPPKGGKWMLLITLAPGESSPLDEHEAMMQDIETFE